jgi:glycosyltransferase involved in cell wall biosynthesis
MVKSPIRVCFIALGAYPLLAGKEPRVIIGPDVHQTILIKQLVKYNLRTSVVTYEGNKISSEYINDIHLIKIPHYTFRIRVIDILLKAFRLGKGMLDANADIYFHAGGAAGITSLFCKFKRKKYIYSIASDALVDRKIVFRRVRGFSRSTFSIGNFGNWIDIQLADVIIVQSEHQKNMLLKNFGREAKLIRMPFPLTKGEPLEKAAPPIVLWVGSIAEVKQPELFLKLAEAIPEARFQMIGGHSSNQEYCDRIRDVVGRISNLEFLGVVPFDEIDEYFNRASILVNTSMFEGFPNAFIQAWMHYVPVVSLNADPDELICEKKLGFHSKTFDQLVEDVKILLKDEQLRQKMGKNSRQYVEQEHDISNIIKEYIGLLDHIGEV